MKRKIANWGQYPLIEANELYFRETEEATALLNRQESLIARGNGRCYGDASLADTVISTLRHNKIVSFDRVNGSLNCQAGITLDEVLAVVVPAGWFLPVTPGTKFITLGGAVASDVHGKNHHKEGSFCQWVDELELIDSQGRSIVCSPTEEAELFRTTCGGMGLTGIITRVRFRLKKIESIYIKQTQYKAANLQEMFRLFEAHTSVTYSMAWIDCLQKGKDLGRGIFIVGEHAVLDELPPALRQHPLKTKEKLKLTVPFNFPSFTLNTYSVKAFNFMYYHKLLQQERTDFVAYDPFFYPLDAIHHWNRMYGSKGFVQYQLVLPMGVSFSGLSAILRKIADKGFGSFLAVLKLFGPQNDLLSFPMEGYTLALDFPVRSDLFPFLDELDEIVHELGGRIYLSKDARMKPAMFLKGYPMAGTFLENLKKIDPEGKFSSMQSKRLNIHQ